MQRDDGKLSFVALYHEIKESTLQTVRRADVQRWEKLREQYAKSIADCDARQKSSPTEDTDDCTDHVPTVSDATTCVSMETTNPDGSTVSSNVFVTEEEALGLGDILCPIQEASFFKVLQSGRPKA